MAVAGRLSGPEVFRYPDPATDLEVFRLTDPSFASGMTAPHLRQFSRRNPALLYWSERHSRPEHGSRQAFLLDLKTGESHQLTDAAALDSASLAMTADEKNICFFDGPSLMEATIGNGRAKEIYKAADRNGFTQAADGALLFAEKSRIVRVSRGGVSTVLDAGMPIQFLTVRPGQPEILYRCGEGVFLAGLNGAGKRQLRLQLGKTGEVVWTPFGRTLLYLHVPEDPKQLIELREHDPADGADRLVARTTQFESVGPNADASVFVGACRSRASAYVLLLFRVVKREFTVCEHKASDPAMVSPRFSPDSQRIFFVSDRHGKPAIYRVRVDKFVEETEQ